MPIIAAAGTMKRGDIDDARNLCMPHVIPTRAAAAPRGGPEAAAHDSMHRSRAHTRRRIVTTPTATPPVSARDGAGGAGATGDVSAPAGVGRGARDAYLYGCSWPASSPTSSRSRSCSTSSTTGPRHGGARCARRRCGSTVASRPICISASAAWHVRRDGVELTDEDDPRAIDFVVEMRRYDEAQTLAARLERGELQRETWSRLDACWRGFTRTRRG